jgi:hypothetical protein
MRTRQTFKDILLEVEDANSARVMRRARRRCYKLKARALEHGIAVFPQRYLLASVEEGGRVVGITWAYRASFHLPTDGLGAGTLAWVEQQRAHVSRRLAA